MPERRTKSYKFKSHYCVTGQPLYYVPRWVRNEVDACLEDILAASFNCNHRQTQLTQGLKMMYIKANRLLTLTNSRFHG